MRPYSREYHEWFKEGARRSARVIVPIVVDLIAPRSVVDVGCGAGSWLAAFRERGVDDIVGIDGPYLDRDVLDIPPGCFVARDLRQPLDLEREFDLVVCLEVAEHLPEECAGVLIASLASLGPAVLFSAAIPGQGGDGHMNERWPGYWTEMFARHSFVPIDVIRRRVWDNPKVDWWYAQNALCFVDRGRLGNYPALKREHDVLGEIALPLVHPAKYGDLLNRRLSETAARKASRD